MRLVSLEVAGFRGFAREHEFDLDADAVIVVGANGNGKTSLFDAILWAITGRIQRLGGDASIGIEQVLRDRSSAGSPAIPAHR